MRFFLLLFLLPSFCFADQWRKDLLRECTSLWLFNEGGGETIKNEIEGMPNLGFQNGGGVWVEGRNGWMLEGDGINDHFTTNSASLYNPDIRGATYSFWFFVQRTTGDNINFVEKRQGPDSSNTIDIQYSPGAGSIAASFRDADGGSNNPEFVFSSQTLKANSWLNLTFTRAERDKGIYKGFSNGVRLADVTAEVRVTNTISNTAVMKFLGFPFFGSQFYYWQIKAIGIWNRELSEGEVGALYTYFRSNTLASSD